MFLLKHLELVMNSELHLDSKLVIFHMLSWIFCNLMVTNSLGASLIHIDIVQRIKQIKEMRMIRQLSLPDTFIIFV